MLVELETLRSLLRCLRSLHFAYSFNVVHVDEIWQRMQPWSAMQPIVELAESEALGSSFSELGLSSGVGMFSGGDILVGAPGFTALVAQRGEAIPPLCRDVDIPHYQRAAPPGA